jgi:hypothetical protein
MFEHSINIKYKLIFSIALTLLIFTFMGGYAKADSANVVRVTKGGNTAPDIRDGCGKHNSYVNTIVYVELVDENGNFVGYADNFNVNVQGIDTSDNWYNGSINWHYGHDLIHKVNADGSWGGSAHWGKTFSSTGGADEEQQFQGCDSKRVEEAFGPNYYDRGAKKALVFQNQTKPFYVINCGYQNDHARGVRFTGQGTPSIPSGFIADGWASGRGDAEISPRTNVSWQGDINKDQFVILLRYKVKGITDSSKIWSRIDRAYKQPALITKEAGNTISFEHYFHKGDGEGKTWNVDIFSSSGANNDYYSLDVNANGAQTRYKQTDRYFAQRGGYCEWADYIRTSGSPPQPKGSSLVGPGFLQGVCASIIGWNITGSSGLLFTNRVSPVGSPVIFWHRIFNYTLNDAQGAGGARAKNAWADVKGHNAGSGNVDFSTGVIPANSEDSTHFYRYDNLPPGLYCQNMGYGPLADNNGNWADTAPACVNVYAATANTPPATTYEKQPANGATIRMSVNINVGNSCPPPGNVTLPWSYSIVGNGINITGNGPVIDPGVGCVPGNNTKEVLVPIDSSLATKLNAYSPQDNITSPITMTTTISGDTKSAVMTVNEVPYARFYGNDIYARSSSNGNIKFNDTDTNNGVGTGSILSGFDGRGSVAQYAAIASGSISLDTSVFRSATGNWLDTPPPKGNNLPGSSLGSMKSVSDQINALRMPSDCKNTMYGNADPTYNWGNLSQYSSRCYEIDNISGAALNINNYTGNVTGPITYRGKYTIKANGDVYITNNIENATNSSDYSDPAKIGVLLIAANNIYIDKSVERVDAILMANNNIITCTNGSNPNIASANWDSDCRNTLTINGSLSAANIEFRRSIGTRLLAPNLDTASGKATCRSWAGIKNCTARGNGSDGATNTSGGTAELINFPAYLYFAKPYLFDESSDKYNSVYNSAPRL